MVCCAAARPVMAATRSAELNSPRRTSGSHAAIAQDRAAVGELHDLFQAVRHIDDGRCLDPSSGAARRNSRVISRFSSAAVGSSRMSTRQRRRSALAMATICCSAKPSCRTGRSGSGAKSNARELRARLVAHARAIDESGQAEQPPHRQIAERQVFGDRQRRHEMQLLRDGDDARCNRVVRARQAALAAADRRPGLRRAGRRRRGCEPASICRRRSRRPAHGFRPPSPRNRRHRAPSSPRTVCECSGRRPLRRSCATALPELRNRITEGKNRSMFAIGDAGCIWMIFEASSLGQEGCETYHRPARSGLPALPVRARPGALFGSCAPGDSGRHVRSGGRTEAPERLSDCGRRNP